MQTQFKEFKYAALADLLADFKKDGVLLPCSQNLSLFQKSHTIDKWTIPNSLSVHPMEGCDGLPDGAPSPLTERRYLRFASGGAGLIWFEAIACVPEGRANPRQLYLTRENLPAFRELLEKMRKAAAEKGFPSPILIAQLNHAGRHSRPVEKPSPIRTTQNKHYDSAQKLPSDYPVATDEYLASLPAAFARTALLCQEAGFDGVDIKMCHGYLLGELLSAYRRPGPYGGSLENRARLVLECINAIKNAVGEDLLLSSRMNLYDGLPYPWGYGTDGGEDESWSVRTSAPAAYDPKEAHQIIAWIQEKGVRLLDLTMGNPYFNPHVNRPYTKGGYIPPENPLKALERMIGAIGGVKKAFPTMTVVSTGYTWFRQFSPFIGAGVLETGMADIIGFGRMAFAYPDFASDILKGNFQKSKCCITCSKCTEIMRSGGTTGCPIRDPEIYVPLYRQYVQNAQPPKKAALVTGGTRGIGKGIAQALAKAGWRIAITGTGEQSSEAKTEWTALCGEENFLYQKCDISRPEDRDALFAEVLKKFGRLDLLVNNAGIAPKVRADILETTPESVEAVLKVNLEGTFFMCQGAANIMKEQRSGTIINITSVSAYASSVNRGEYCMSKAGLSMVTTLFADRMAEFGVYVYEIRPGIIATDMTEKVSEKYDKLIAQGLTPIQRWGQPEDIAQAVLVLAEGRLGFSTGIALDVDGGFHIRRL